MTLKEKADIILRICNAPVFTNPEKIDLIVKILEHENKIKYVNVPVPCDKEHYQYPAYPLRPFTGEPPYHNPGIMCKSVKVDPTVGAHVCTPTCVHC